MWQGHDRVYVICGFADDGEAAEPALATDLAVVITQRSVATRRAGLVAGEAGDQVKGLAGGLHDQPQTAFPGLTGSMPAIRVAPHERTPEFNLLVNDNLSSVFSSAPPEPFTRLEKHLLHSFVRHIAPAACAVLGESSARLDW